ncbi:MAG TPA: antibiotic biosynthesis monooxygenase [Candidatus Nanopelagicales bacterium]|jgi:hypothetical protein
MHARLTMVTGDPRKMDDLISLVDNDVRPLVEAQPGSRGMALFVARDSGEGGVVSFFDSAEAMQASAPKVMGVREKAVDLMAGSATVENFEVAVFQRRSMPGPGAWMRLTRTHLDDLSTIDAAIEQFRSTTLPALSGIPGLISSLLFVDRESGNAATTGVYQDHAALDASRDAGAAIRAESMKRAGLTMTSVAEYELIFTSARPD